MNLLEDDKKMEELMMLQSMSETESTHNSIEEKYEESIMMDEVMKIVDRQLSQGKWNSDNEDGEEGF